MPESEFEIRNLIFVREDLIKLREMIKENNALLDRQETADLLGTTRNKLGVWVSLGLLTPRIGNSRKWFFSRTEVKALARAYITVSEIAQRLHISRATAAVELEIAGIKPHTDGTILQRLYDRSKVEKSLLQRAIPSGKCETNDQDRELDLKRYQSDLSDEEWSILEKLIPQADEIGRPRNIDMRKVVNGIFYVFRTGCRWPNLPANYPPFSTVNSYYRRWRKSDVWLRMNAALRENFPPEESGEETLGDAV